MMYQIGVMSIAFHAIYDDRASSSHRMKLSSTFWPLQMWWYGTTPNLPYFYTRRTLKSEHMALQPSHGRRYSSSRMDRRRWCAQRTNASAHGPVTQIELQHVWSEQDCLNSSMRAIQKTNIFISLLPFNSPLAAHRPALYILSHTRASIHATFAGDAKAAVCSIQWIWNRMLLLTLDLAKFVESCSCLPSSFRD